MGIKYGQLKGGFFVGKMDGGFGPCGLNFRGILDLAQEIDKPKKERS